MQPIITALLRNPFFPLVLVGILVGEAICADACP